jgi:hypothetical protein
MMNGGKLVNGQWIGPIQIDGDDVEYLTDIWRNRYAVTGDLDWEQYWSWFAVEIYGRQILYCKLEYYTQI